MPPHVRLSRFGGWAELQPGLLGGKFEGPRPFFAGVSAYDRMDRVRQAINELRNNWDHYPRFMDDLRSFMDAVPVGTIDAEDLARREALFASSKSWGGHANLDSDEYSAIRLYTSEVGYRQIFGVINTALRSDNFADDTSGLRAAAFIVELLNIDLFNYRAQNPHADNFEGTVYRGMCVSAEELEMFKRIARAPIAERYISIPLSMASSSMDRNHALKFALEETARRPEGRPLLWEIKVHSLDSGLLNLYRERFPASVVTSLCAVPVDRLSDFPREREVLLRGPHFQVLRLAEDELSAKPGRPPVSRIETVMLNSNRDHVTAIASNEGSDREARNLFRSLVLVHRSMLCAQHADEHGTARDADEYRTVAAENRALMSTYLG